MKPSTPSSSGLRFGLIPQAMIDDSNAGLSGYKGKSPFNKVFRLTLNAARDRVSITNSSSSVSSKDS